MQTRLRRGETDVLCSELTGAGKISSVSSFSFNCQVAVGKAAAFAMLNNNTKSMAPSHHKK